MRKKVCLNCKNRKLYCHDACEDYAQFVKENAKIKAKRAEMTDFNFSIEKQNSEYLKGIKKW